MEREQDPELVDFYKFMQHGIAVWTDVIDAI